MTLIQKEIKKVYLGSKQVRPILKTFTITRTEQSNMSSGWTYSDDATGLTAGDGAFDTFFGYSAVLLDGDGNEVEEIKQSSPGVLNMNSFTNALTGTANNVMIKFPLRGIKMSKSGSNVTLSITSEPNKEGYQYYAHTKGTKIKDNLYLGAYVGVFVQNNLTLGWGGSGQTYLKSWATNLYNANVSPAANQKGLEFLIAARKNGIGYNSGYSGISMYARWYIAALYMMKYGNPDSQSVVGQGYFGGSGSNPKAPGGTNSQTSATYGTSSFSDQIKLFGLEDRWGNMPWYLDYCSANNYKELTVDKTNSADVRNFTYYNTNLGGLPSTNEVSAIEGTNEKMFKSSNSVSSDTYNTYYADIQSINQNAWFVNDYPWTYSNVVRNWAGVHSIMTYPYDSASANYGGRIMYL